MGAEPGTTCHRAGIKLQWGSLPLALLGLALAVLITGCAGLRVEPPGSPLSAPAEVKENLAKAAEQSQLSPGLVAGWRVADYRERAAGCLTCPIGWAQHLIERLSSAPEAALLPFEISPEIQDFAVRNTRRSVTAFQRASSLVEAMYALGRFQDRYEAERTTTAAETLISMRGNCFAFTNLFVASARSIGLDAYFLDASRSDSSVRIDGQHLLHAGHIVAGVETEHGRMIVDFYQLRKANDRFWYRRLVDTEVVALFVNNLGYEAMRREEDPMPFFLTATALAPGLEAPWNNLATVLKSRGELVQARDMLTRAVEERPDSFAPYYNLGLILLQEEQYVEAERVLWKALLRRVDNPAPLYQMGIAYLRQGKGGRARLAFRVALQLDRSNSALESKLDRLNARR